MSCFRPFALRLAARASLPISRSSYSPISRAAVQPLSLLSIRRSIHSTTRLRAEEEQKIESSSQGYESPPSETVARATRRPQEDQSNQVFVANLPYSVTEQQIREAFGQFGNVKAVHILKTVSGMSRGAMFVHYDDADSAERAIKEMDEQDFGGRRIKVQKPTPKEARPARAQRGQRTSFDQPEESNSLFIGNMSFSMSDRDLNGVFGKLKNCIDVRVAIDRRTGQPRGFAHADFTTKAAAIEAKAVLEDTTVAGRKFRVTFATPKRTSEETSTLAETPRDVDGVTTSERTIEPESKQP